MLTSKQESFCKQVALDEKNYSDAYRHSYSTDNMKDETIHRKAYELIENGKVTARIEELKASLDSKAIEKALYTREQSFNYLRDIQDKALKSEKYNDIIKAEELKGKLASLYIDTTKLIGDKDHPIESSININFIKPISDKIMKDKTPRTVEIEQ